MLIFGWIVLGLLGASLLFMHINRTLGLPALRVKDFVYIIPFSLVGPIMALVFFLFISMSKLAEKYNKFLNITIIE